MVLLALLVATTLLQVLSRYVLSKPLDWTEETARYLFVWVAMLGAGMAAKDRAHFFVDLLLERLPPRLGKYVTVLTGVVASAFLLVISWAALDLAVSNGVQEFSRPDHSHVGSLLRDPRGPGPHGPLRRERYRSDHPRGAPPGSPRRG